MTRLKPHVPAVFTSISSFEKTNPIDTSSGNAFLTGVEHTRALNMAPEAGILVKTIPKCCGIFGERHAELAYDENNCIRLVIRSNSSTRGVRLESSRMQKPCLSADAFRPTSAPRPELSR